MAKSKAPSSTARSGDLVQVKLKCVYSGFEGSPGPGEVIAVDAAEADRLISLGAAEPVSEE